MTEPRNLSHEEGEALALRMRGEQAERIRECIDGMLRSGRVLQLSAREDEIIVLVVGSTERATGSSSLDALGKLAYLHRFG